MNTIIIDKENNIDIKDNVLNINIQVPKLTIKVKGKVLINEIANYENEELDLTLDIEPNSSLIYNRFIINKTSSNTITINQDSLSNVTFNYSLIATDENKITLNSNLKGNDNTTSINIKAITEEKGKCLITSTANTYPKIENNNLIESIKILLLNDEESVCIPNLLVASNEIEVNHACTMSSIDKNYMFYLNSKGISNTSAINIIKKGYLLSNLDINDEIIKYLENIMEVN